MFATLLPSDWPLLKTGAHYLTCGAFPCGMVLGFSQLLTAFSAVNLVWSSFSTYPQGRSSET